MSTVRGLSCCDAATSRSSAKRVAGVVSKFCDVKKQIVRDIGFGGILEMPQINKIPRKFTVWLLSRVNVESRSIVVEGRKPVELSEVAFQRVLGIPNGQRKLKGLESNDVQEKMDFIKLVVGSVSLDPMENCSLKVAEDIICKEYPEGMNIEEINRFKVSFVIFAVGHFLVAKTRTNHGMDDYWGSLMNTTEIHLFNYCTLVIDEIIASAKRVQEELRCNRQVRNVTGCTLGLQVLYLDSLELKDFMLSPDHVPRIALFNLVVLKRLINADQHNNISYYHSETSDIPFDSELVESATMPSEGKKETIDTKTGPGESFFFRTPQPAVSTYLTAYLRGTIEQKLSYGQIDALKWHNARMIHHVRKTKEILFEGVSSNRTKEGFTTLVEVHMEALMAKIFQDNLSMAQRLHANAILQRSKSNNITSWPESVSAASSFYESRSEGGGSIGVRSDNGSETSIKMMSGGAGITPLLGKRLFQEDRGSSVKRIKQEKVETPDVLLRKNEQYLVSEEGIHAIIENGCRIGADIGSSKSNKGLLQKLKCKQKRIAPNPWKFGVPKKQVSACLTNALYEWLENNNLPTLRRNYVMHALPKYIELDGYLLKDIFINKHNFSHDALDIALRRISQLDSYMYGRGKKMCWRHIMETDFAMVILKSMDPLENISIISQFTMRFNSYDISECRMIIVPVNVNDIWCAYFWDMEELKVHVIDPCYEIYEAEAIEKVHMANIEQIQKYFARIVELIFDGWHVEWTKFKTNFVKPIVSIPKSGSDGLLTVLAVQEFDGNMFAEEQNEVTIDAFNKLVLYEMLSIEGNYGKHAEGFIQSIS